LPFSTNKPEEAKRAYLYRLFRPEFVKLNPVPLSSDTFSKFGQGPTQQENEKEIADATNRLINEVIPNFCQFLETRYHTTPTAKPLLAGTDLSDEEDEGKAMMRKMLFKANLEVLTEDKVLAGASIEQDLSQFIAELHMHGINCHLLLHVYARLKVPYLKRLVLTEACARTAKSIVEEKWRCTSAFSWNFDFEICSAGGL